MTKILTPIAHIENDFIEKFGIPRQSGRAPSVISKIVFEPEFRSVDALRGLDGFSHVWLIFDFSQTPKTKFTPLVRPPRLGGNQKVGVFASRSPFRPNTLGLSCVKIKEIVLSGENAPFIIVYGADILDKTPIYDIKPYLPLSDCIEGATGGFSDQEVNHKLEIKFLDNVDKLLPKHVYNAVVECLKDDPRPAYQNDERIYGMRFGNFNIKFYVKEQTLFVVNIEEI